MRRKKRVLVLSTPVSGRELRLYQRFIDLEGMSHDPLFSQVVLFDGEKERAVRRPDGLCDAFADDRAGFERDVAGNPSALAHVFAELLDAGRVVTCDALFCFLEDRFGIRVAEHLPRVEGGWLRFLAGRFREDRNHDVRQVSVHLATGESRSAPLGARTFGEPVPAA